MTESMTPEEHRREAELLLATADLDATEPTAAAMTRNVLLAAEVHLMLALTAAAQPSASTPTWPGVALLAVVGAVLVAVLALVL